ETYEVAEGKWTHRIATAELHGVINIHDRSDALFQSTNRVEHVWNQQAIDDESSLVAGSHRDLAQVLPKLNRLLVNVIIRQDRLHDFDQLHQRHRIEKVHADKTLLALGRGRRHHLRDRQR